MVKIMLMLLLELLFGVSYANINHIQDEGLLRKQRNAWNTKITYTPENPNFTI